MIRYALFAAALIGVGSAAAQSTTYVAKDKGLSGSALVLVGATGALWERHGCGDAWSVAGASS